MIEYDFILSGLKDVRRRLEVLIRASDDPVEAAHLYGAKHWTYETEKNVQWARECHDNPRMEVKV